MKLKEYPHSIYQSLKLLAIPSSKIRNPHGKVLPLIVSLTTIPSRLNIVHLVIRSILSQNEVPQKVVLFLNDQLKSQIPNNLKNIQSPFFEIHYSQLTCSHRKLIHALELYPDRVIVTSDDDLIYPNDWLLSLYDTHLQYPKDIVAHRVRQILYNEDNEPLPYKKWKYKIVNDERYDNILPIGSTGVLYPPHCLMDDVTDSNLFLRLTPKADDLWFKAMSYLNGTRCRLPIRSIDKTIPVIGSQRISLKKVNVRQDFNREQWSELVKFYGITFHRDNAEF